MKKKIRNFIIIAGIILIGAAVFLRASQISEVDTTSIGNDEELFFQGSTDTVIIFFHGLTATPEEFIILFDELIKTNHSVYVPTLKGHGRRPIDLEDVTWRDWERQADEIVEEYQKTHNRVYVGGLSLGADLALLVATDHELNGVITLSAPIVLKNKQTYFAPLLTPLFRSVAHPIEEHERGRYYESLPPSALAELLALITELKIRLPQIEEPLLMFQSNKDPTVEPISASYILEHVNSQRRKLVQIDDETHVIIDDRERAQRVAEEFILFMNVSK